MLFTPLYCIGCVQETQYGVHDKDGPEQGWWAQLFPCSCSSSTATCKNKHLFTNENRPPSSYLLIIIINILLFSSATEYRSLFWNFMVVITVIKKSKHSKNNQIERAQKLNREGNKKVLWVLFVCLLFKNAIKCPDEVTLVSSQMENVDPILLF